MKLPDLISKREAYRGRLLRVECETVRNPSGEVIELEMIRHPGASAIVPILGERGSPDPQILVLRQYRYAAGGMIWEIPAGVLEPGESPETCAHRELLEETGAVAGTLSPLTTIYTTPGFTDEKIHLFSARDLKISAPSHEADEFIEVTPKPLSELLAMVKEGEITDGKTIVGLLYVAGFELGF